MNSQSPQQPAKSKNQRRSKAREQTRQIHAIEAERRKRTSWLIKGSVVIAALVVIVLAGWITVTTTRTNAPIADSGPKPANTNEFSGVTIGAGNQVVRIAQREKVDRSTLPPMPTSRPTEMTSPEAYGVTASGPGEPVKVVIYVDFACEFCKVFEAANETVLAELADAGKITYEYRASGLLDNPGSQNYSSRASAVAACVVNTAPERYLEFFTSLYKNQPTEGTGLSTDQLKQYARDAGANVDGCVDESIFLPFVQYATAQARLAGVPGTPSVYVDGQEYQTTKEANFTDFRQFVLGVIGAKQSVAGEAN